MLLPIDSASPCTGRQRKGWGNPSQNWRLAPRRSTARAIALTIAVFGRWGRMDLIVRRQFVISAPTELVESGKRIFESPCLGYGRGVLRGISAIPTAYDQP